MNKSKMEIDSDGDKTWRNSQGQLHNEEGPAVIYNDGTKAWLINGKLHRENGQALISTIASLQFRVNGKIID